MSEPVRHHFVPKVYLEQFCLPSGEVNAYDFSSGNHFLQKPNNLARKKDYNTITLPDGSLDRTSIERFYGDFESKFPRILAGIHAKSLSFSEQRDLILISALQIIRSPMTRDIGNFILNFLPHDIDTMRSMGVTDRGIELLLEAKRGSRRALDEASLVLGNHGLQHFTKLLDGMDFWVVKLENSRNLITSDNPVIMTGIERSPNKTWQLTYNIPQNRVILLYPLTPKVLLFGDNKKNSGKLFSFSYFTTVSANSIVKNCNAVICSLARRNLFSNDRKELELALSAVRQTTPVLEKKSNPAASVGKIIGALYSSGLLAT